MRKKLFLFILLTIIAFVICSTWTWKSNNSEHFIESHIQTTDPDYKTRITVMKVFELVNKRIPSMEEIQHFSKFTNEHDIFMAVTKANSEHEHEHVTEETDNGAFPIIKAIKMLSEIEVLVQSVKSILET